MIVAVHLFSLERIDPKGPLGMRRNSETVLDVQTHVSVLGGTQSGFNTTTKQEQGDFCHARQYHGDEGFSATDTMIGAGNLV